MLEFSYFAFRNFRGLGKFFPFPLRAGSTPAYATIFTNKTRSKK